MAILAVASPTFQPAMRIISGITNAFPAVVTTSFAHQFSDGLIVRLVFPLNFGMEQAHKMKGEVTVLSATTFSVPIDTTLFTPFVVPGTFPFSYQSAHVVPVAEENSSIEQATRNVLPY